MCCVLGSGVSEKFRGRAEMCEKDISIIQSFDGSSLQNTSDASIVQPGYYTIKTKHQLAATCPVCKTILNEQNRTFGSNNS